MHLAKNWFVIFYMIRSNIVLKPRSKWNFARRHVRRGFANACLSSASILHNKNSSHSQSHVYLNDNAKTTHLPPNIIEISIHKIQNNQSHMVRSSTHLTHPINCKGARLLVTRSWAKVYLKPTTVVSLMCMHFFL